MIQFAGITRAQTTNPDSGPLRVHVTAVQGGAQFRPDSSTKWQAVTVNLDLSEGVEFRTGPKGTIQFTVGSDQVYRVDRLTVIKVLRANLNPDGTIHTDVGMTYGRVSKDVDLPQHPHEDTIITPSSTLAVRGTQVGIYDQVPYSPEATSLTGKAIYHNASGQQFSFGSKGGGTNKVSGDAIGAAQFQLTSSLVAPTGNFSGLTAPEIQNIQTNPGGPPPGPAGSITQHSGQIVGGTTNTTTIQNLPVTGGLGFGLEWQSNTEFSVVDLAIRDPNGLMVSSAHPPASTPSGPTYIGSDIGDMTRLVNGETSGHLFGMEFFTYGNATGGTFLGGNYTVTITLQGAGTQTLSQVPTVTALVNLAAAQFNSGVQPGVLRPFPANPGPNNPAFSPPFTLQFGGSTATFNVPVPIHPGPTLTPVLSH